jgi:hypothetical protein
MSVVAHLFDKFPAANNKCRTCLLDVVMLIVRIILSAQVSFFEISRHDEFEFPGAFLP